MQNCGDLDLLQDLDLDLLQVNLHEIAVVF